MFDNIHPITISNRASEEIHKIIQNKGIPPDYGLRVGIKGGGCSGIALMIGIDKKKEALAAYLSILTRWRGSLPARIGAANVLYAFNQKTEALKHLESAVVEHPESAFVWHNLAVIQGETGLKKKAKISAAKALSLATTLQKEKFLVSLKEWL